MLFEPELDAEHPRDHEPVLASGVAHHPVVRRGRAADVVDHVEEVHVLVLVARQTLPPDARVELDDVALGRADHRPAAVGGRDGLPADGDVNRQCVVGVDLEDLVEGDPQLRDDGVQRADGGLGLSRFDLRDQARRHAEPAGELSLTDVGALALLAEPRTDVSHLARHRLSLSSASRIPAHARGERRDGVRSRCHRDQLHPVGHLEIPLLARTAQRDY